ncbi:MAG: RyR domain-containing protein [Parachlamydiales bacterium]|jgi:hypothetical protein
MEDYQIIDIAKVCHEANKAFCETLGDHSQKPWSDAPNWQKESAIIDVKAKLSNPDMTSEQSHESWMKTKLDAGWKWGPEKDAIKKEHPCLVPYHQLPRTQQLKDHLFQAIVTALS